MAAKKPKNYTKLEIAQALMDVAATRPDLRANIAKVLVQHVGE